MNIRSITTDEFESIIYDYAIVFVDFWADWCAPCVEFSRVYASVAANYPDILFAKVDIKAEQALVDLFEIRSIPHLMVFKDGILIYSENGSMPESTLHELVQQAITVDVSDIREALQKDEDVP